jgi:hypothetical protein
MNSYKNHRRFLAAVAVGAMILAGQAWASTLPLNQPRGLAIKANGDLYVANQGGDDVLVYGPKFVQLTANTITQGVSQPSGVALDAQNNLYVANGGTSSITEYLPSGQPYSAGTITGINTPWGIAVDALGNVYVSYSFTTINVYTLIDPTNQSGRGLTATYTMPTAPLAIATYGASFAWGSLSNFNLDIATYLLDGQLLNVGVYAVGSANEALAMAYDNAGDLYVGDAAGNLYFCKYGTFATTTLAQVGFGIEGIAVDNARGRIYLSNEGANQIAVYSTAGQLITVIK